MHARIPLSVVLSAPGLRHAVPNETLKLLRDGTFFSYLDSDDTRLPNHPYLNGRPADPTEYDTYTGEDVWEERGNVVDSSDSDGETDGGGGRRRVRHAELVFDDVVEWFVRVLDEDWARDGVVICGRYAVADDATWAVPSRSPTVYTPREALMVMRCSCKFLTDVHAQRQDGAAVEGEITVVRAMAGPAAKEMRAFVPYRLSRSGSDGGVPALSGPLTAFAGICQRHTDVCFPSLMAWTETEHQENFSLMMERLTKSRLVERTCEQNPQFLPTLLARWVARQAKGRCTNESPDDDLYLFLAVDLLFETASLPIHLLSAKVRLFAAEESDPPAFVGLTAGPYLREPPAEKDEEGEGEAEAAPSPPSDVSEGEGADGGDEEDEEDEEDTDAVNFFRLFRNEFNWNHYVEEMEGRWEEAARAVAVPASGDASQPQTIPPAVLSDLKVKHYCVVASEASDLITSADTLTKRGLPLELMHPELLQGNEEGMTFLRELGERMMREARQLPQ